MSARIVKINKKTLYDIVHEVHKRPCLWNTDDEYYNNRGRVAVAWDEITTIMELPEALIRAKWKNMRDLFKRELKKYNNTNTIKEYIKAGGRWKHFKMMWFLHKPVAADQVTVNDNTENSSEVVIKEELHNSLSNTMATTDSDDDAPFSSNVFQIEQFQQDPLPINKRCGSEDDYDMMFLKSLAPYFHELDPVRKLKMRNKIQDIILNEINAQRAYGITTH